MQIYQIVFIKDSVEDPFALSFAYIQNANGSAK